RIAIASPATDLLIYQTDGTMGLYYYTGTVWISLQNSCPIVCVMTASVTASLGTITANYVGGTPPYSYAWDGAASSATTSIVTGMSPGTYNLTVTDVNGCTATANTSIAVVNGCTDSMAFNYNQLANTDDGSCIAVVNGCTDSTAINYDPLANTDDGSCIAVVNGCTDTLACNFDPGANQLDSSCVYVGLSGCTDPIALNYLAGAVCDDGSCISSCSGATTVIFTTLNYMGGNNTAVDYVPDYTYSAIPNSGNPVTVVFGAGATETNWDEIFVYDENNTLLNTNPYNVTGQIFSSFGSINIEFDTDNSVSRTLDWSVYCDMVLGCTDSTAINYDPMANVNDSALCCYLAGCTDSTACNYDALASCDDGSCILPDGCTDSTACNYDANALCDDGSCILPDGCTDALATNYDANALCDDGSCTYLYGCPVPKTVVTLPYSGVGLINCGNGNNVTQSNTGVSSLYFGGEDAIYVWTASSNDPVLVDLTNVLGNQYTGLWVFDDCPSLGGATVVTSATSSSGPESVWFNQITGTTYYIVVDSWIGPQNCNTSFDLAISIGVFGCINSTACNYDNNATIDDGSCDFSCLGCTDSTACNYDLLATIDDGSCDFSCLGCTDSMAFNYDPLATIDDGSCIAVVNGCTTPTAANYNANANVDDGSCLYPGCMDSTACNYDNNANLDNGSCSGLLGCTIVTAPNYNSSATCDDGSCIIYGCTDPSSPNYNPLANTDDGSCLSIGDTFQGGIIFYLDGNGGGLIAAPSDQLGPIGNGTYSWTYGWTSSFTGASGTAIGTGQSNTSTIVYYQGAYSNYAARVCQNLTLGGYSDWFLPSKDELNQMYLNKTAIGGFNNSIYWSSTEYDWQNAWWQSFGSGNQNDGSKNGPGYVRAVRAF
ncbi:MAG: DUF1566 domain-containing protein, partial [Saprospiraceae bacterium]|nr:DUF1566 domain-containing protein [Saprospiraceae bacterium]